MLRCTSYEMCFLFFESPSTIDLPALSDIVVALRRTNLFRRANVLKIGFVKTRCTGELHWRANCECEKKGKAWETVITRLDQAVFALALPVLPAAIAAKSWESYKFITATKATLTRCLMGFCDWLLYNTPRAYMQGLFSVF